MKQLSIIVLCACVLSACSGFLERNNPENVANDYFTRGTDEANQVIDAVYSTLQKDAFYSRFLPMLCMVRSDEGCLSPNASKMEESFITLSNYNSDAAEKYTSNLWQDIYSGILRANFAIEKIPQMENVEEDIKTRILGEAYFLRSFFNWHLVMNYGEQVPVKRYTSKSISDFEQEPGKDGELWGLILSDLEEAQRLLGSINYTNTSNDFQKGRVSLGTVTAYLGQAYLFYAQMKNHSEYYQKAADELAKVIKQEVGNYSLMKNYRDNFLANKEYNEESLFEVGFSYIGTDVWGGDGVKGVECAWMAMNAGMTASCSEESPRWWNLAPSNTLLRFYEDNDYRKWMNFWFEDGAYYIDKAGVHAYSPTGDQLAMGFPVNPYPKGEGKTYIGFRKYEFDYNPAQLIDFIPETTNSSKYRGMTDINVRLMRYADVLLLYAECQIMGQTSDPAGKSAVECMAEVRRRANNQLNPQVDEVFQYTYGNKNLPYFLALGTLSDVYPESSDPFVQLQHERLVEFAGEGKRYYDIIRWYKSGNLRDIDPDSDTFGANVATTEQLAEMLRIPTFSGKFLLPIPQYELNTNPKMEGNESN